MVPTAEGLADLLLRAAAAHPDSPAVVEGGTTLTYRDLLDRAEVFAGTLVALGVRPGDRVTAQLPTWWETPVVLFGCALAGAVCNPVVPIYREHEVGFIVGQARPRVLVVPGTVRGHDHLAMARGVAAAAEAGGEEPPALVVVRPDGAVPEGVTDFAAPAPPGRVVLPAPAGGDEVAVLLYTSGSTAEPKGVLHSHRTLLHEARQVAGVCRLGPEDRVFMASPLTHVTGLAFGAVLPVDLALTSVLLDRWEPARAVDLVEAHGCTFTVSATTFLLGLTREHEARGTTSSLRVFVCGGAEIGPELVRRSTRVLGARVVRCYGSTEMPTFSIGDPYGDPDDAAETDGAPVPLSSWRTHDETGELLVAGAELFLGYLDARLDADAFTEDGFFRTGDVVTIDDRGARVVGRTKDIIIRGGENLSAIEIEDHLAQHPDVLDVAVVAVPDEVLGERACAYVVPAAEAVPDLDGLRDFLTRRGLAVQKTPERLELVEALPRTPSGKVQKFKLREAAAGSPGTPRS
ncbi:cyclohexanecarboxylate-CoA ligase [Nocardioides korecus]